MKRQSRVAASTACQNTHQRPIRPGERTLERPFIGLTGFRRTSWMCVDPDPRKPLGSNAAIDLFVKKIRHSGIVERHSRWTTGLPDQSDIFHQQQIVRGRDPKASYFGRSKVTQEYQLRPGVGREPQLLRLSRSSPPPVRVAIPHLHHPRLQGSLNTSDL